MNKKLLAKLKKLPAEPGVYFHKSADGEVIYVGKAAVLKNRVRQYFRSQKDMDAKTRALVAEIADTDWTTTESEIDALFLESEMIKRYMPRYNILLRDDKSQTFVRINMRDEIPFVSFTRRPLDDGAEYFGPFYSGAAVKNALRLLRRIFPYYVKTPVSGNSKLEQQIGLTPGVETGATSAADYKKSLRQLISYIKGNRVAVTRDIEKAMKAAAQRRDYEAAAHFRNQLRNLGELRRQIVFGRDEFLDISRDQALVGLRDLLNLPEPPRRIEGYDISHHGGKNSAASMVVATNGVADKAEYRKFRISVKSGDDLAAMREVIARRLKHLRDWGRPDLVILDGGAGQIGAVADLLAPEEIPVVGRNKSGDHGRNAAVTLVVPRADEFETLSLDSDSHIAKLVARLDDEAHRFAVSYHTALKRTAQTKNELEEIPGIGPATRRKLLRVFGSLTAVRAADHAEIAKIIGKKRADLLKYDKEGE
ncbi:MAG: excinuclease ABC subunit UvrC [Candidatus Nomurabacteria bacterium]|jgi:excinuclease ABC subunit C|nr:excinuclease ABC subunit UvrC [Candidatus Nomurabacteria bacterium]